jgi:hypothetical protein
MKRLLGAGKILAIQFFFGTTFFRETGREVPRKLKGPR